MASLINVTEMLITAQISAADGYQYLEAYIDAALIYWAVCGHRLRRESIEQADTPSAPQNRDGFPELQPIQKQDRPGKRHPRTDRRARHHQKRSEGKGFKGPIECRYGRFDDGYSVQLSGGQQQRVSIARALAIRPDVILLDEPTSALDPERVSDVNDVITRVADTGVTMILVTHEIRFARNVASRIVFMENGIILEEGTPKQVIDYSQSPRLKEFLSKIMSK